MFDCGCFICGLIDGWAPILFFSLFFPLKRRGYAPLNTPSEKGGTCPTCMMKCFPTPVLLCSIHNKFAPPRLSELHVAVIFLATGCPRCLCVSRPGPCRFPLGLKVVAWPSLIRRPTRPIMHRTPAQIYFSRLIEEIRYLKV